MVSLVFFATSMSKSPALNRANYFHNAFAIISAYLTCRLCVVYFYFYGKRKALNAYNLLYLLPYSKSSIKLTKINVTKLFRNMPLVQFFVCFE